MPCYSPVYGYRSHLIGASGKRGITFKPTEAFFGEAIPLPCGKCIGCKLERARVWAIRCLHESKMHKHNCFVTLTYDNEHLPSDGSLVVRHLQLFMKRLRVDYDRSVSGKLRFYACGEYGDHTFRPHYHALLFGIDFFDKRHYSESARGDVIYTSKVLDGIWGMGSCKIGEVNFETAGYVARYCLKKVDGAKRDDGHYLVYNSDGVVSERLPEFSTMSRRPGIGTSYYDKFGGDVRRDDNLVVNGKLVPSIRYYDLKHEALDSKGFAMLKAHRRALKHGETELSRFAKSCDEFGFFRHGVRTKISQSMLKAKRTIL